jgi:CHAT domain-containing protein
MQGRYPKLPVHRLMSVLFLCSLTFSLCFGEILSTNAQAVGNRNDVSQLVSQGVEKYQAGNFPAAIDKWNSALNVYPKDTVNANVTIINENIARAYRQLAQGEKALPYWEKVTAFYSGAGNGEKMGRSLTEQAQSYINMGQPMKAIAILCGTYYQNGSDKENALQTALGKYQCKQASALEIARREKDKKGEVAALGSLGEAYHKRGDYGVAIQEYLEPALDIGYPEYEFALSNSLGKSYLSDAQLWSIRANSARQQGNNNKEKEFSANSKQDYQQALNYFQNSLKITRQDNNQSAQMQVLLNLIQLSYRSQPLRIIAESQAVQFINDALQIVNKLPLSRSKVYALIDLANLPSGNQSIAASRTSCQILRLPDSQVKALLENAVKSSEELQDSRAQSFALGSFGHYYECQREYNQALELTKKAISYAEQGLKAEDSLYLWEWQAGRIFSHQEEKAQKADVRTKSQKNELRAESQKAYKRAEQILKDVRQDILLTDRDLQFDFRDLIKPFYHQLAELSLENAENSDNFQDENTQLNQAVSTVNSLQVAELQNYFGNDCVLSVIDEKTISNLLGKNTAVFNSLILDKGVAIVLSVSDGQGNYQRKLRWMEDNGRRISLNEATDTINQYRQNMIIASTELLYKPEENIAARKLYKWIIKEFEEDFKARQIDTLVFVQSGILRTVPMAALYDAAEQKYLIEKYAVTTTPSLSLTTPNQLKSQENSALILGLYEEAIIDGEKFVKLPNVDLEITKLKNLFPENKLLTNKYFQVKAVEKELENETYPVIHIATHAQFGTIPDDTFIVTGNNGKLTIDKLDQALRQTQNQADAVVELLTLSACQTAFGDERAALGLAGVAVQAGVKTAVASLWSVDDASTSILVAEFYRKLKTGMSKAEALRAAQIKLIHAEKYIDREKDMDSKFNNPYYWSPFILIGNWL